MTGSEILDACNHGVPAIRFSDLENPCRSCAEKAIAAAIEGERAEPNRLIDLWHAMRTTPMLVDNSTAAWTRAYLDMEKAMNAADEMARSR